MLCREYLHQMLETQSSVHYGSIAKDKRQVCMQKPDARNCKLLIHCTVLILYKEK